jgi:hypothetical protein
MLFELKVSEREFRKKMKRNVCLKRVEDKKMKLLKQMYVVVVLPWLDGGVCLK